ncbi:LamG domain-containing protein [Actinophytocola algeriensis]|uniref:Beta-glucanase (GH16 family) n=1 Tax=Actinophytocola algeriensis TaxID=1768010 RepID=A0A7W7Q913_9PSEU|nr:hypothetical protein [Actinophytocola algeriensis]MBB4909305.1 beta-glucanase (GH16 family) [Actinophytocola algeriensis]MBE1475295.1 beta-glucanase (GH16 family) [Actinophytocola algeriensis]
MVPLGLDNSTTWVNLTSVACGVEASRQSYLDDFDTLDTNGWYVSNGWHNGAGQNCTWDAAQVSVASGRLNLSYTKKAVGDRAYDFYVNGQVVHSITGAAKIPDRETNLFLNLWGSENNADMGTFVPPSGTVTFQVDRVAYTAPGGECQFTGSIACT